MKSENFTVYKSSAGSGKTYTLVKEYLKLALSGGVDAYKSILAITFTNKAANEMKERVLEALRAFSNQNTPTKYLELFDSFKEEFKFSEAELRQKSQQIYTSILHNYADFSISTIDKFSHKIVRTFAYDLKLNVGFEVELDEDELLKRAIDQLIDKAGTEDSLTDLLLFFTEQKIEKEGHWQIEQDLMNFSKILLREMEPELLRNLNDINTSDFFEARETLNELISNFKQPIIEIAKESKLLVDQNHIEPEFLAGGAKSGLYKYLEYLISGELGKFKPTNSVRKYIDKADYSAGKATKEDKGVIASIQGDLSNNFMKILNILDESYEDIYLAYLIEQNLLQTALLTRVEAELEEVKKEQNTIPISDFNKSISDVVAEQPVPFIYERIGEKYKHYLIDEFQDTSVMQWQNLLPLIENSLGNGHFNMIVGDEKQAIYRFRGGEVEQFTKLPSIHLPRNESFAKAWEESLKQNISFKNLEKNWRSKIEVISFNNDFFTFCANTLSEELSGIYKNAIQKGNQEKKGGGVQINFYDEKEEEELGFREYNLSKVLSIIDEVQKDGYEFRDIAILTQTNRQGAEIAAHLSAAKIPVISSDSLKISASPKVGALIHLLHLLVQPGNDFHAVKLSEYLHEFFQVGTSSSHYSQELLAGELSIFNLLDDAGIGINQKDLRSLPLYECFEQLMRTFGWMNQADGYLQSFLDVILKFTAQQGNDKVEFLNWWESNSEKFSVKVPDGIQAVTVLSVHKSKGLEFPIVLHPFANYKAKKNSNLLKWIPIEPSLIPPFEHTLIGVNESLKNTKFENILDEETKKSELDILNVLYVALTRAAERLYILTTKGGARSKNLSVNNLFESYANSVSSDELEETMNFGTFEPKSEESQSRSEAFQLKSFVSNDWRNKLRISYRSEELWDENKAGALSYGNLIHDVLSRIESADETETAVRQLELEGYINEAEAKELLERLMELLSNDRIAQYYKSGVRVRNEAFIVHPNGEGLRPDRLIFEGKEVVIIDYKTGMKKDAHLSQVKDYMKVLDEMGYKVKEALLVYIGMNNEIVQVL